MRSGDSLIVSRTARMFEGFMPPCTSPFSCKKSKVASTGAIIPAASSGVNARCAKSSARFSLAGSNTTKRHGAPSTAERPECRMRSNPACGSAAVVLQRSSCHSEVPGSSGISLMAASGAGSLGRWLGRSVKKTAEFCETPSNLRSGNRPSTNWPRRCCAVCGIKHRQSARGAAGGGFGTSEQIYTVQRKRVSGIPGES